MSEENAKLVETTEQLTEKRLKIWAAAGQHQFTKAFIEAELLQMNQELLRINNKLAELSKAQPEVVNSTEATTDAVLSA